MKENFKLSTTGILWWIWKTLNVRNCLKIFISKFKNKKGWIVSKENILKKFNIIVRLENHEIFLVSLWIRNTFSNFTWKKWLKFTYNLHKNLFFSPENKNIKSEFSSLNLRHMYLIMLTFTILSIARPPDKIIEMEYLKFPRKRHKKKILWKTL